MCSVLRPWNLIGVNSGPIRSIRECIGANYFNWDSVDAWWRFIGSLLLVGASLSFGAFEQKLHFLHID